MKRVEENPKESYTKNKEAWMSKKNHILSSMMKTVADIVIPTVYILYCILYWILYSSI